MAKKKRKKQPKKATAPRPTASLASSMPPTALKQPAVVVAPLAAPKQPPPAHSGAQSNTVTLSQCMIVKDEERNIEKALSWGKNIVCEQIVVDTGSTDRTVEIAEKMGAKIYHFEWINDFGAAKNYAIEQATGNWIAFLDADEYIPENEVKNILPLLEMIQSDPKNQKTYMAVNCPLVQLDDKGNPKEILEQERFFRNLPKVRYVGKIHEQLSLSEENVANTKDFRIMHTGYTNETFTATGKASRNVKFLREKLAENPNDIVTKAYLADALKAEAVVLRRSADTADTATLDSPAAADTAPQNTATFAPVNAASIAEEKTAEAEMLYNEVLNCKTEVHPMMKMRAYEHFLYKYSSISGVDTVLDKMSEKAFREFPDDNKFICFYAMALNKKSEYAAAYKLLKKCELSLSEAERESSELTMKIMELLSTQMIVAAQGLWKYEEVLIYAGILLMMNKTDKKILHPYIVTLVQHVKDDDEAIKHLASIYDMKDKAELLFLARTAKDCGAVQLARRILAEAAG